MISDVYSYLLFISLMSILALYLSKQKYRVLHYLPPIVLLYLCIMILSSGGLFTFDETLTESYSTLKSNLLPAMLFLMLLPNKISYLLRLGPKMLLSFMLANITLFIAFITTFILFSQQTADINILSPLAGSWMGGTGNMIAVSSAINGDESELGITMLIDSIDYSLWVMFLLFLVPFAPAFNRYTRAKDPIEDINLEKSCAIHFSYRGYAYLLLAAVTVSMIAQVSGIFLSHFFASATTWSVLVATMLGVLFSFSPLSRIRGVQGSANAMLYLLIALIASRAQLHFDSSLLYYISLGLGILSIHALLMLISAKLFRLDLFSISVASLANIGGIASAPILSAAYAQSLVGVGVLMASMGYVLGTFVALILDQVLRWMV